MNYLTDSVGLDDRESLSKETAALRRTLDEECYEKEVVQKTATELRNTVIRLEMEKLENTRAIHDLRQRISRTVYSLFVIVVPHMQNALYFCQKMRAL